MQLKWSIPEKMVYRSYYYKIAARNVLNVGLSDHIKYRFVCNPDNSGSTVTTPAAGYSFCAVQVSTTVGATHHCGFDLWAVSQVHNGCYFL